MHGDERCRRAVCGRTARTVRQGAAGEAHAHGETDHAPARETGGTEPVRPAGHAKPAAYLTAGWVGPLETVAVGARVADRSDGRG
jgi:hypothetical protein